MHLPIRRLHEHAVIPEYATAHDAGLDLCTVAEVTVAPGERAVLPTGIAIALPAGYVGLIWDKSGVSTKRGVTTIAGVIDAGYRGEITVALYNIGHESQTFTVGTKVAQLLVQPVAQVSFTEVAELDETERGAGGFGSTGE